MNRNGEDCKVGMRKILLPKRNFKLYVGLVSNEKKQRILHFSVCYLRTKSNVAKNLPKNMGISHVVFVVFSFQR